MSSDYTDQPRDAVASELRRAMSVLIPDRPPVPIFERVAAARRRRVRLRSALAASTAAVAIVTTPTLLSCVPTAGTVDEPAATQPAAAQCPGTAPPDFFTFGAAPTREVAAAPIVIATICRYGGANEPQGRGALVASGVVRGDELAELMRRLEASDDVAQPVPCPTSFGAKHVLYLGTAAGSVQRIDVHLGGCGFVATDTATYWSTEELREFLAAHVG